MAAGVRKGGPLPLWRHGWRPQSVGLGAGLHYAARGGSRVAAMTWDLALTGELPTEALIANRIVTPAKLKPIQRAGDPARVGKAARAKAVALDVVETRRYRARSDARGAPPAGREGRRYSAKWCATLCGGELKTGEGQTVTDRQASARVIGLDSG